MRYIIITLALIFSSSAMAGWFGPSTFDECILKNMKGVTSNVAARVIYKSCRAKYPEHPEAHPDDMVLPLKSIENITGRAGIDSDGSFSGNFYNGNDEFTVTQVTIGLTKEINIFDKFEKGQKDNLPPDAANEHKKYRIDIIVPPLTSKDFRIQTDGSGSVQGAWTISDARGYKVD